MAIPIGATVGSVDLRLTVLHDRVKTVVACERSDVDVCSNVVRGAQMCSQEEFGATVRDFFNLPLDPGKDLAAGLLRNVRMPTAQMDVFSVITQIGADHLVSETSSLEVRAAFGKLREACDFFMGAAGRLAYLNSMGASHCYRSTHWYARGQSEAV